MSVIELYKTQNVDNSGLNNIPDEILLAEITKRNANKLELIAQELNRSLAEQREINATLRNQIEENKVDLTKQAEKLYIRTQRTNSQEYGNRTVLGRLHDPQISAVRMSKLLKYAGILRKMNNEPLLQYTQGKEPLVHVVVNNKSNETGEQHQYVEYRFHIEKTWNIIRDRLTKDGLLIKYLNCKTKEESDSFIDRLVPDDEKRN